MSIGRYKTRLGDNGILNDIQVKSVYSGVASLRSIQILVLIMNLNEMETWNTDIGNAYLEAKTMEEF